MTRWQIQLLEHPAMVVDVDDDCDLARDFQQFARKQRRGRFWQPAPGALVDAQMVVSVQRVRKLRNRPAAGF